MPGSTSRTAPIRSTRIARTSSTSSWRGTGTFVRDGERRRFGPGDVIFVPAAMTHRFEDFSEDFATWVVFWGAEGGEIPQGN